ncbi:PfkB family carbohydrate kinase [Sulfurirhabdus autotrophica]|uniref:Ketohexokinase n=3 Tax=Sulfurirhabdus autotrophica TaxID=1706046 RepID=A0A4R3XS69_9PROT|nr:PfkB family carbohydrate kinase [Sulfurirhabdus autotrophica]TCV80212.1 ketohexokinase [Sulfurirhabdus autotrophica]
MARILGIGVATLDMIFDVARYPSGDEEVRAKNLRVARGGNVANTLVMLSQLGHACSWGGVLAEGLDSNVIVEDLARYEVDLSSCVMHLGRPPTSTIMLSRETGTRTIVHYRDLPEFSAADFDQIVLLPYDWIHFEGRNVPELDKMLKRVKEVRPDIKISLEVEKPRPGLESVFPLADVLLCSHAFAIHAGMNDPHKFLAWLRQRTSRSELLVGWGNDGAYGLDTSGNAHESPAYPPDIVLDTLGAGDTFNASMIDAFVRRLGMKEALDAACRLAGRKCGIEGFAGVVV